MIIRMRTILAVLVVLSATALVAQTFRGTILGTVTDATGAVVSGATVKVHNVNTGQDQSTQTSADGSYTVPELQIGTYSVTVSQSGFETSVTNSVSVDVATERRVDVALKPGQVTVQVEVSGESLPQVETTTNDLGGVITAKTVENLPVNGRDYTKLIYLNPGVSGSPDQISDSPGSFGEFSMNGARGRSNNYLIDGTDMNDGYRNDPAINEAGVFGTPSTILPLDAIAEVNVISNFQPEYGRSAGAIVNIVTKSGTNTFHGSAAEYFRNDALDARNYFNDVGQPKAPFHNNQYGGAVGGPIIKNKTFFYADYEGQQEPVGVVTLACVPDPAQIAAYGGATNPVIASLLATNPWPAPNIPGTFGGALVGSEGSGCPKGPNSSVVSPSFNRLTSFIAKIDQNFNPANKLTGRYFFGDSVQSFPLALTASGGQLPGFNTYTPTRVQLVSLSYVHTFGSNKVNDLRYGWNRFAEGFFPGDQSFAPSSIGLNTGTGAADQGLPIILMGGFAQLGATSSVPRHRVDSNNQLIDGFSWNKGKHNIKFGFDFHRTSVQQYFDKYFRGRLKFDGSTLGTPLQDFLAGDVDSGFQYFGDSTRHTYQNNYGFYVQDSYRITPRVTLNYGLRWDYFGVMGEKNDLLSNITSVSPAAGTGTFTLTQVGQPGLSQLYNPNYHNFAPRLSFAWDMTGKGTSVIRAGYGIFFDAFSQDMVLGHLPYAPFFDPGPAYNNIGPAPILSTGAVGGTIVSGSPVYAPATTCEYECDVFGFDRHIKTPYMENFNVNFQQQIAPKMVVQLAYVGSQGHHLWRFFDLNQPSAAAINTADLTYGCIYDFGSCSNPNAPFAAARPFGGGFGPPGNAYGAFYVLQENSTGQSNYNSLQASYRINGWHGITSMVNYVWSKSLDNSSDGEDFEPNAAQPNDSNNPQLEYGPSNFNIPNRFTWIFSYDLPHMGGSMQRLKNGWGTNSTVTLQSGQPFQLNYNFEDDFSGSGNGFDRPDVVGPIVYHPSNPSDYVDLSSFAIPCTVNPALGANGVASDCVPGTRHYGDEGRDSLHGPTYKQWDLAIYKTTAITERVSMQLRVDFINVLNHPNFANPFLPAFIADPGVNGFQLAGNREVGTNGYPITATGDVGIGNPFLGGGAPRGIQLGAKFNF
jgi:Carboxypeptidase regulatory-like domain/TonB dependent receptor/TonB-dependent Receptor Plug Domain